MAAQEESAPQHVVRVLALHGSEGNGEEFQERLQPLVDSLRKQNSIDLQIISITAPVEKGGGYAWWSMPPGVRSFNAQEYDGFETSASLVLDTIKDRGPFDIVLGHSQGAILVAALLALERIPTHPTVGYILNGVAMPNPFKKQLEALRVQESSVTPRVLFVLGENDKMNPLVIGDQVKDCMIQAGLDTTTCYHPGGHSVPVRDETAVETISQWILDGLNT